MANAKIENDADEEKEVRLIKLKFYMKVLTKFLLQSIELDKLISEMINIEFSSDLDDEKQKLSKLKGTNTKAIEGELSIETYAILSHTFRAIVDYIKYLLDKKGFKYVYQEKSTMILQKCTSVK